MNYLVFDKDQWISYDDEVTFKQKVEWANKIGLGGSMIWASDLDDDKYSAHSAMLGRKVKSTSSLQDTTDLLKQAQQLSLTSSIKAQTGENCIKYDGDCVDLNDNKAMAKACGDGFTVVGWDDAGCGKTDCHCGKPICCPTLGAPTSCKWRGDDTGGIGGDCSSQCNKGEINVANIQSSWGGGFTNDGDTNKCKRGRKAFCCVAPDFDAITQDCSLSSCSFGILNNCPAGKELQFTSYDDCWFGRYKSYCCGDPSPVSECHWVSGSGGDDCVNARCDKDEIELDRSTYGGSPGGRSSCGWGRKQVVCCKIGYVASDPATCASDMCDVIPGYCPPIDYDDSDDDSAALSRRDGEEGSLEALIKRGGSQEYTPPAGGPVVTVKALPYPGPTRLYTTRLGVQAIPLAFRLAKQYCFGPALQIQNVPIPAPDSIVRAGLESEHVIDVSCLCCALGHARFHNKLLTERLAASHCRELPGVDVHGRPAVRRSRTSFPNRPIVLQQMEHGQRGVGRVRPNRLSVWAAPGHHQRPHHVCSRRERVPRTIQLAPKISQHRQREALRSQGSTGQFDDYPKSGRGRNEARHRTGGGQAALIHQNGKQAPA